jgi:hypothetical protein
MLDLAKILVRGKPERWELKNEIKITRFFVNLKHPKHPKITPTCLGHT